MLYLSAIFLAFFLAFVLITKRHKSDADVVLVVWLTVIALHLSGFYLFYTEHYIEYPSTVVLGFPLPLAHGPLLFLYTRLQTLGKRFHKKQLLHLLPLILSYSLFTPFFLLPFQQRVEIFKHQGQGFEMQMLINVTATYLSGIIYLGLSLTALIRYRKSIVNEFSNTERINFNWLLYLILWMIVIWTIIVFVQKDNLIFGAAALFVIWLGYFGIKQVQIFQQPIENTLVLSELPALATQEPIIEQAANESDVIQARRQTERSDIKYQKSTLSDEEASLIHQRLKLLMDEQKPYTDPELTLNDLAKTLDIHPNYLSQVINSKENKSFYDLVNEKRVEEFTCLVSEPDSQQFTLLSLAYECGFNSKASFNRNFKKYTGLTPTEYVKGLQLQLA